MPSPLRRRRCASGGATTMPAATTSGSFRSCGWPSVAPRRWRWPWSRIGWRTPAARGFSTAPSATVLQHGIAHADHAVPPAKKIELGGKAARAPLLADLGRGRELLAEAFGEPFPAGARAALEPDRSRRGVVATRVPGSPASRPSGRGARSMRPRGCGASTRIWTSSSGATVAARSTWRRPSSG